MASQLTKHSFYQDKSVVVTGANRGIGLALVEALTNSGAMVWGGCRQPANASALKQVAERTNDRLSVFALDVTDDKSVEAFAKNLPAGIDVLFNNAGVHLDQGEGAARVPVAAMEQTFQTNTLGPLRMMQMLQPKLAANKGRVANISSIMGSIAQNEAGGATAYRVSKAALNMLTKNFALLKDEVIYLALHPGWVQTDMGGDSAPVVSAASAAGLLAVVAEATSESSGSFFRFDGKVAPW